MTGEDCKALRKLMGLTQEELADRLGISRRTVVSTEGSEGLDVMQLYEAALKLEAVAWVMRK